MHHSWKLEPSMGSILNGLNIGYSGLTASQLGINTTGQNISNAETEGYTRQRTVQQNAQPLTNVSPGAQGNGTTVKEIVRIHDEFVFARYRSESENKEFTDFQRQTLEELSTYFPEIENVGIKFDMQEYFNLWGDLSVTPDNQAIKVALAKQTETLSRSIQQTSAQIYDLQSTLNDQLKTSVDEINRIGVEIANLNQAITNTEAIEGNHANDLRDKRGVLELALSKLVDSTVFEKNFSSNMPASRDIADRGGNYTINVGGFNLVDGKDYHPIVIENKENPAGFYDLFYERQDGFLIPMAEEIKGGRVGAILDLRGNSFDENGALDNGQLQEIIKQLDGFAAGLIESTNNLYAQGSQTSMSSDVLALTGTDTISTSDLNIEMGTFNVKAYDIDGNVVGSRAITISYATSMDDIVAQMAASVDDNSDGNATNDIDDMLNVNYTNGQLQIEIDQSNFAGYTFAIEDDQTNGLSSGTNFAGATGLSKFFEGTDSKTINLKSDLRDDPSQIRANKAPIDGENKLANDMLQLQFEKVTFDANDISTSTTIFGYFDSVVTDVGTRTNSAITRNDTITAKFNSILASYESTSKVNIDEEMINLIKYQTAYGAAAKIITTIDQMMDTLLGLKQ